MIIALGTLTSLLIVLLTALNPVGTAIGLAFSSLALGIVVLAYLWLDRFEPEPPRLLVFAFVWGASAAVVIASVLQMFLELWLNTASATPSTELDPVTVLVGAPVTEEAAKGLFLILMMTGVRRNELNSLTDCLVYAGLVGAGFAWLEDVLYIADGESLADSLVTALLRLIMSPFAHSLFTMLFAVGVWFSLNRRSAIARTVCILGGYAAAVLLHALWNGSALLGAETYLGIYAFWMMPIFGLAVTLAISSRRREQRVVTEKLPGMVAAGVVTPNEATWLGSLRSRRTAIAEANRFGGKQAGKSVTLFVHQVIALAFVRDRVDRGFGDQAATRLGEQTYAVYAARNASPALAQMAGFRT